MLSESSRPRSAVPWIQRTVFAHDTASRRLGVAAGVASLLVIGVLLGLVASGAVVLLLLIPIGLLSWYGGLWAGRAGALAGSLMQSMLGGLWVVGSPRLGMDVVGFALTLAVLLLVAQVLPTLRIAARAHREHSRQDPLTGLGNRRFFRDVVSLELHRARRYRRPVSVATVNADGFERVNEAHGFAAGDALLGRIGQALTSSLRASDVVARIAGDEFGVLLPETDGAGARNVVDKLRDQLALVLADQGQPLTFTTAIVGVDEGPASIDALFRQVDQLLLDTRLGGPGHGGYRDYEHSEPAVL